METITALHTHTSASPGYCHSLTEYVRFRTREVNVGDVPLGGERPIRLQSMTDTDTMDVRATVEQCLRIIEAGADYVRITAPSQREAQNLSEIRKELRRRGYQTPLIADIHFTPNAAELAARLVEKVRVNPGNYADKKNFSIREYTGTEYNAELERIRRKFTPLVKICKQYGTAMRIGANHGSLSDRIMNRYGDTPLGMVESALEFVRICEEEGYRCIVLSMKASNPVVMVEAYRLLVKKMQEEGMNYPLHLGVTEAGDGEDGRIKSALGIGALLEDGLGDTVRVSLTEPPEAEIPVAKALVERYARRTAVNSIPPLTPEHITLFTSYQYNRRVTEAVAGIGGKNHPIVVSDLSRAKHITDKTLSEIGHNYSATEKSWKTIDPACDFIYIGNPEYSGLAVTPPSHLSIICDASAWMNLEKRNSAYPLFQGTNYFDADEKSPVLNFIAITAETLTANFINKLKSDHTVVLILESVRHYGMAELRWMFLEMMLLKCPAPAIIKRNYCNFRKQSDKLLLYSATDIGGVLVDGMGDGVWLSASDDRGQYSPALMNRLAFGILQSARTRIFKTDYVACPSCGRTLFNLQETTARIRERTSHLKGVKIAVMGCIVNGPGEMADAHYGYVGTGPGRISLYKGKEVIKRNIPAERAVDELIELIRRNGDWVDVSPTNYE